MPDSNLHFSHAHTHCSPHCVCSQGSNWVQKSRSLLDSLAQRTESVDRSEEAAEVRDELSVYVACTVQEQEDRVTEVRGRESVYLDLCGSQV